jgi:hypothetical protein
VGVTVTAARHRPPTIRNLSHASAPGENAIAH